MQCLNFCNYINVILGMNAHQVAAIVRDLPAIMGPQTAVLTAQNGIPWWYFFKHGGPYEAIREPATFPRVRLARPSLWPVIFGISALAGKVSGAGLCSPFSNFRLERVPKRRNREGIPKRRES